MSVKNKLEQMAADRKVARAIMRQAILQLQKLNGIAVYCELAWNLATLRMSILKSNPRDKWPQINEELDKLDVSARRMASQVADKRELAESFKEPPVGEGIG